MHQPLEAGIARSLRDHRSALDRNPVLGLPVRAHRVDGRDEGAGAGDRGDREVGVVELADVLFHARDIRPGSGAAYDGAHGRTSTGEDLADPGPDETVRAGDDNNRFRFVHEANLGTGPGSHEP